MAMLVLASAFAAALPTARAETPAATALARELRVPFEDLGLLFQADRERVLLKRSEYEDLLRRAVRKTAELAPAAAAVEAASCDVTVEQDRALLKGVVSVEVLREGLHAVPLDLARVGLRSLLLDGAPAPAGLDEKGRLVLFVEKTGLHRVEYEAVAPLQTTAAQQILSVRLPDSAASSVLVTVPGDVEVRGGAAVAGRVFDGAAGVTRLELVPDSRDLTLVMTLNSRLKRQDRIVVAQSVLVDEISQACERLHATITMDALHQPVKEFRFGVPAGFEVTRVDSPDMARWEMTVAGGAPALLISMRDEAAGKVTMYVSAIRTGTPPADWSFPALQPMDVASSSAVMGILLEDRLRLDEVSAPRAIPMDYSVLLSALPPAALAAEAGEARARPVGAWYAPDSTAAVTARFEKPPARLQVTANTLVALKDGGLEASGGIAVMSLEEKLFAVDIGVPEGWDFREIRDENGAVMQFERRAGPDGTVVHMPLAAGADAGLQRRFFFTAVQVPANWFSDWQSRAIDIPGFPVLGATRDRGAVAVDARDDMRVSPAAAENLFPLDENEKARFSLADVAADLAYRYESRPYKLRIAVERVRPRLTAETFSFFAIDRDALTARCEVVFKVSEARTREVALLLGTNTPASLSVSGVAGTQVKEYAAEEAGARRRWVVRLAGPAAGSVHLAVDYQTTLTATGTMKLALDPVRADGVAYQSGFIAVEGSPELDVGVERHPRKVDIGELVEAEYRPGRRLLGAYGFVGEPDPVEVTVARRELYRVPPSLVQRAELTTMLGSAGTAQTMLRLSLRNKMPFVELALPDQATLWSVLVDGKPSRPQQREGALLIGLPAGKSDAAVIAVYEQPVRPLGFWTSASVPAPRLFAYDRDATGRAEVPISDATWEVHTPTGYRAILSGGTMSPANLPPIPVAPVELARALYRWAGGIGFRRGIVGACSAPFQRAAQYARMSSEPEAYRVPKGGGAPSVQVVDVARPAIAMPPPPPPGPGEGTGEGTAAEELRKITIPEIDFRQANIRDVVDFLQQAGVEFGKPGEDGEKKTVNIALAVPDQTVRQAVAPADPFAPAQEDGAAPQITFSARYISLYEALKIVAEVANLKVKWAGETAVLVPKDAPEGEIVVRMYDIGGDAGKDMNGDGLKDSWVARGITWPAGSSIQFASGAGKLVVANTPENLDRIDTIIAGRGGFGWGAAAEKPPAKVAYGFKMKGGAPGWMTAGSAGLTINLSSEGKAVAFSGLGIEPSLKLKLIDEKRVGALSLAAALGVLLAGLRIIGSSARRKTRFVTAAVLVSALVPALPGLVGLALVMNGVFYAACGLLAIYLLAGLARRRGTAAAVRAAAAAALLLVPGAARGADGKYVVEMTPPEPVTVPADALVVPYRPDSAQQPDQVLVPLDRFRELWKAANPEELALPPPAPFALAGGAYTATLLPGDALVLRGSFTVNVFAPGGADVPLPLDGGVLESALLDGAPAMLRSGIRTAGAVAARQVGQQAAQQRVSQADRERLPLDAAAFMYVPEAGPHRVELVVRMKIGRQGGWRSVDGRLPAPPAASLDLRAPDAQTEVLFAELRDRASYRTQAAGETISTALGDAGRIRVQWRPVVAEGEIDRTLTAESSVLLDMQEDGLYEVWDVTFRFRRGERDFFTADVPPGHIIDKVTGGNVKGWEVADAAGVEGFRRITVRLLKAAENQENFCVVLRRPMKTGGGPGTPAAVPCLSVPEAVRHTGRITIRGSPLLVPRALAGQGVRRTDLAAAQEIAPLAAKAAEGPFGLVPYQTYEFMASPFELAVETAPAGTVLRASLKTVLRLGERDRSVETRVELNVADRAIYAARFEIPAGLDVETVTAPGTYEWVVTGEPDRRVLVVRFAAGTAGTIPVVIGGPLRQPDGAGAVTVPRIAVIGAAEQEGDIAVQADPASDVKALDLKGLETILLSRVQGWLRDNQKELVRLALRHTGPSFSGKLQLVPRVPDVSAVSATNVRVTDRAIEETTLFHFTINNAGIREVRFALPSRLADARVSVPLLRRKTVTPVDGRDLVMVKLELQDEVMNDLKVLVESDRLLVSGREESVTLPVSLTGRTDRRYLALESAGRDEVVVVSDAGFEPLSRQQKEWAAVASLFRGGSTRAFMAGAQGDPVLAFSTRQRAAVETAGARIGLAQAVVVLDAGGAFRAAQTYHVDNRTEQFLELAMPAGAELWAAEVAGEPVKPVRPETGAADRIRIPLVKTASGDLDYRVVLHYGGTMKSPAALRSVSFPLIRAVNIGVELSQVQLRLPRTHSWMRFDGTMREITDAAEFDAGILSYRNKVAQRLLRTLQFGSAYEKARSASNLRSLKKQILDSQQDLASQTRIASVNLEMSNAQVIMNDADEQLARAATAKIDVTDNRLRMNETYGGQGNVFTKNVVMNTGPNWDRDKVPVSGTAVSVSSFNSQWFDVNGLVEAPKPEVKTSTPGDELTIAGAVSAGRRTYAGKGQVSYDEKSAVGFKQLDDRSFLQMAAKPSPDRPRQRREGGTRETETERADRYAAELGVQRHDEMGIIRGGVDGDGGERAGRLYADGAFRAIEPAAPPAAGVLESLPSGLASLSIELPPDDPGRWTTRRFTTALGDMRIRATAVSLTLIDALRRTGLALVAALVAVLLPALFSRRMSEDARRAATGAMIICGCLGLLAGVFPIAGLLLAIAGVGLKIAAATRRA